MEKNDVNKAPDFIGDLDFHLKAGSPCIDAGFTGSMVPVLDIEGNKRPQGQGVDIGAYEFSSIGKKSMDQSKN